MAGHIRGVEVAFVHSGNGQQLAEWYEEVLGLPRRFGDDHWIEFAVGGASRFAIDVTGFPRSEVEAQPLMISFTVDDLEAAVRDLDGKGVAFYPDAERTIFDVGPTRVATFRDPDGNWLQLAERKTS